MKHNTQVQHLQTGSCLQPFGLNNETVQGVVDKVKSVQQKNPLFDKECLARCNIPEPDYPAPREIIPTTQ